MGMSILLAAAAFVIAVVLTRRFCDPTSRFHILDQPNPRSLHTQPTPRSGGLAILAAVFLCGTAAIYFAGQPQEPFYSWMAGSCFLVAGISYADDRFTVPSGVRFVIHALAASALVFGGVVINPLQLPGLELAMPYWAGVIVTLLFVVWMLNLYNFMDGMDGFAGGMAVFGFGTFAVLGLLAGGTLFAVLNLIIAAAALGFLVFNFPPARIFMGDVGSSTLGFLAASMSLWAAHERLFPFWAAVLVFSPFVADATVTLIRRLLRGERVWQAHKTHYYQRLVQAGWGHRKTVLFEYAVMLGCAMTALEGVHSPEKLQTVLLVGWMLFYFVFFVWVSRLAARHHKTGTL
jgi:UDP-N-acetylmuramyl pentapeptide phosphotransferase/UDP-N-acetylglucosamine-1-phosphate transferase